MRRFVLTITTLILLGSSLVGSALSQDVFRYASDPFSTDGGEAVAATDEAEPQPVADAEPAASPSKAELESYESWPSASKSPRFQRAAERAKQRDQRIAARKWQGVSASRPAVYGDPHVSYTVGAYAWLGGNAWVPGNWYSQNLPWYYPRRSYSSTRSMRWIAVPAGSYNSAMIVR